MSVKNSAKVPDKKWRKWSAQARFVFNNLYYCMYKNQWMFLHPQDKMVTKRLWKTVCWNAAWLAADAVDGDDIGNGLYKESK